MIRFRKASKLTKEEDYLFLTDYNMKNWYYLINDLGHNRQLVKFNKRKPSKSFNELLKKLNGI